MSGLSNLSAYGRAAVLSAQVKNPRSSGEFQTFNFLVCPLPENVRAGNVEYWPIERAVVRRLIDRDRESELSENRIGPGEEVVVAVVKRDDDGPGRQIIPAQPRHCFSQGQY